MRQSKWQKLRQLSGRELGWLLQASAVLPVLAVLIKVCGYQRCQRWLTRRVQRHANRPPIDPDSLARMVRVAADHSLWPVTCLPRSLWLWYALARHGHASQIRLGVARKTPTQLLAHAWVELDGRPLNEPPGADQRYAPLAPTARLS